MSRFSDALRRRYASPRAVVRALGLDETLLEENPMTTRRDARDMRRTRDEMTEEERRHPDAARDALRRAGDAAEIDDDTIGELLEVLCETHPEVVAQMAREVGQDGRPRRWAKDRREMRMSRDRMMTNRARKLASAATIPSRSKVCRARRRPMVRDMEESAFAATKSGRRTAARYGPPPSVAHDRRWRRPHRTFASRSAAGPPTSRKSDDAETHRIGAPARTGATGRRYRAPCRGHRHSVPHRAGDPEDFGRQDQ